MVYLELFLADSHNQGLAVYKTVIAFPHRRRRHDDATILRLSSLVVLVVSIVGYLH